jgi:hypothetical protein
LIPVRALEPVEELARVSTQVRARALGQLRVPVSGSWGPAVRALIRPPVQVRQEQVQVRQEQVQEQVPGLQVQAWKSPEPLGQALPVQLLPRDLQAGRSEWYRPPVAPKAWPEAPALWNLDRGQRSGAAALL